MTTDDHDQADDDSTEQPNSKKTADNQSPSLPPLSSLEGQGEETSFAPEPESQAKRTTRKRVGPYKILQKIAEGGMGAVYMAEQEKPIRRRVALKVIKAGKDSEQIITRFEAERQALAMMNHPNIAKVLDVGTTDEGSPYFAMELVKGIPLTQYCDQNKLSINERLELFVPVCKAVQHAHQKGIIHRDLKPSNVLVALYDGEPVPKVIDFGLAKATEHQTKLTDKTMFTEYGAVVGTLQYMSPEQAEMNQLDVDTRTDIYSLGVMLYELLTGSTPLDQATIGQNALLAVLALIRDKEPPRPSTRLSETGDAITGVSDQRKIQPAKLQQILRGELDWIVMKSLEKDRTRRYETANNFADDINRYLNDEVVTARPPSTSYKLSKFVKKNRGLVATLAIIATLLMAGIAAITWFAVDARIAREESELQTIEAIKEKDRADLERDRATEKERLADEVLNIFKSAFDTSEGAYADMPAKDILAYVNDRMDKSKLDDFEKAKFYSVLVTALLGMGEYTLATTSAVDQLEINQRIHGLGHEETVRSMTDLAVCYLKSGQRKKGLELDEETFKLAAKTLGPVHFETLRSMTNLAVSYFYAGKTKKSLELEQRAFQLRKQELGSMHPQTLRSMGNLAISYKRSKPRDLAKALELEKVVLDLRTAHLGIDHPDTLISMNNLAGTYLASKRFDEAQKTYKRTLELRKKNLGENHPQTLRTMVNLAITRFELGQTKDALAGLETALYRITETHGPNHPATLKARNKLANRYQRAGVAKNGLLEIDKKQMIVLSASLGINHPDTLELMSQLSLRFGKAGLTEQAGKLQEIKMEIKKIESRINNL